MPQLVRVCVAEKRPAGKAGALGQAESARLDLSLPRQALCNRLKRKPQKRQIFMDDVPDDSGRSRVIFMAQDISDCAHCSPINFAPNAFYLVWKSPTGFRNDLKRSFYDVTG